VLFLNDDFVHEVAEVLLAAHEVTLLVGMLDDHFEEVVGFLELVVEGEVVAGKLEFFEAARLAHELAHDVHAAEQPAPAALFLRRDASGLEFNFEAASELGGISGYERQILELGLGHGGADGLRLFVVLVFVSECV